MRRLRTREYLDDEGTSIEDLRRLARAMRSVNRFLGGRRALLEALRAWSGDWEPGAELTLLDVGTGSADLPLAAVAWAERAGFRLRASGIDTNARLIDEARRLVKEAGADRLVEVRHADARTLVETLGNGAFDYVHAGMVLHHFDDDGVVRVLRAMLGVARRGVVWNDLLRSRRGVAATWLATRLASRPVRHDALASHRAGFTLDEARSLARRAGLDGTRVREWYSTQRFSVVWTASVDRRPPLPLAHAGASA